MYKASKKYHDIKCANKLAVRRGEDPVCECNFSVRSSKVISDDGESVSCLKVNSFDLSHSCINSTNNGIHHSFRARNLRAKIQIMKDDSTILNSIHLPVRVGQALCKNN